MADAPSSAVFLSYASQDAAAVRRIAEALRSAGVEVWFDQNELVGGDAWDQKIRGQIAACALFVPVISANTNARGEGYFRLEWKLAVDRSHLMAHDQPFLLPVVIDDTADAAARVPPEFRAVQWTRLPSGETLEKFCARVQTLLRGEGRDESPQRPASESTARRGHMGEPSLPPKPAGRPWPLIAIIAAVAAIVSFVLLRQKPDTVAGTRPSTAESSAPLTEARQLVTKARRILDEGDEVNRETYALAEELLKKAEALDVTEASAWALHVRLSSYLRVMGLDRSPARLEAMQSHADRAMKLAPNSPDSRIAMAQAQMVIRQDLGEAQQQLRALAERFPRDARILRELAWLYRYDAKLDDALAALARARELAPADRNIVCDVVNCLILSGRFAEADATVAGAMKAQPVARILAFDVWLRLYWSGDVHGTAASLQKWPAWFLREDRGAGLAAMAWLWRREPEKALQALQKLPRDYVRDYWFTGPRAVLTAWAQEQAGHAEAARADWNIVVKTADRELVAAPDDAAALHWKAWASARLGDPATAERLLRVLEERNVTIEGLPQLVGGLTGLALTLGWTEQALDLLGRICAAPVKETRGINRSTLRNNPHFEPLRNLPRFQALIAAAPGPEEKKENQPATATPAAPVPNDKSTPADKSLVVLPLENLSLDPENAFFTEGMHAQIIATLQEIPDLKIIGRDTSLSLKRGSASLAELAGRVGVANVVTGSVRRAGNKVSVLLELRRARDEALLWSLPKGDHELKDVLGLQSEIADQVARVLLAREAKGVLGTARYMTKNPQAYDLFLKEQAAFFDGFRPNQFGKFTEAIRIGKEAFALDPSFMSAAQFISVANALLSRREDDPARRAAYAAESKQWAEVSSRLAPGGVGDLAMVSHLFYVERDFHRAVAIAEKGVRALPNDSGMFNFLALAQKALGQTAEAVENFRKALVADPLTIVLNYNLLSSLADLRRTEAALAVIAKLEGMSTRSDHRSTIAKYRFQSLGEIPTDLTGLNQADWLWRARQFGRLADYAEGQLQQPSGNASERLYLLWRLSDARARLGDSARATEAARTALALAEKIHRDQATVIESTDLLVAGSLARLGRFDEAVAAAQRAVDAAPEGSDLHARWRREVELAEVCARAGRKQQSLDLIAKLLRVPSGLTVPMLKFDPAWDNVREDAAFQALLADPKNSAPL